MSPTICWGNFPSWVCSSAAKKKGLSASPMKSSANRERRCFTSIRSPRWRRDFCARCSNIRRLLHSPLRPATTAPAPAWTTTPAPRRTAPTKAAFSNRLEQDVTFAPEREFNCALAGDVGFADRGLLAGDARVVDHDGIVGDGAADFAVRGGKSGFDEGGKHAYPGLEFSARHFHGRQGRAKPPFFECRARRRRRFVRRNAGVDESRRLGRKNLFR